MKWDKWTVVIAATALFLQLGTPVITGSFSFGQKVENLTAEIRLLRHEVIAQNALQDAEISNLKARLDTPKS